MFNRINLLSFSFILALLCSGISIKSQSIQEGMYPSLRPYAFSSTGVYPKFFISHEDGKILVDSYWDYGVIDLKNPINYEMVYRDDEKELFATQYDSTNFERFYPSIGKLAFEYEGEQYYQTHSGRFKAENQNLAFPFNANGPFGIFGNDSIYYMFEGFSTFFDKNLNLLTYNLKTGEIEEKAIGIQFKPLGSRRIPLDYRQSGNKIFFTVAVGEAPYYDSALMSLNMETGELVEHVVESGPILMGREIGGDLYYSTADAWEFDFYAHIVSTENPRIMRLDADGNITLFFQLPNESGNDINYDMHVVGDELILVNFNCLESYSLDLIKNENKEVCDHFGVARIESLRFINFKVDKYLARYAGTSVEIFKLDKITFDSNEYYPNSQSFLTTLSIKDDHLAFADKYNIWHGQFDFEENEFKDYRKNKVDTTISFLEYSDKELLGIDRDYNIYTIPTKVSNVENVEEIHFGHEYALVNLVGNTVLYSNDFVELCSEATKYSFIIDKYGRKYKCLE